MVTYPGANTLTSETQDGQLSDTEDFLSFILSTLGDKLIGGTMVVLKYLFRKNLALGYHDFTIDAVMIVQNCLTDAEVIAYRKRASQLDEEHLRLTGRRIRLEEFERTIIGRYRPDAEVLLQNFELLVDKSRP